MIGPAFNAMTTDMTPKDKRGRIMGVMGTLNVIAMIPASMIGGYLYQLSPSAPFLFTLIIGMINILIIQLFIKEPKIKER